MKQHLFSRRDVLKLAGVAAVNVVMKPNFALGTGTEVIMRKIPVSGEPLPAIGLGSYITFDVTSAADRDQAREVLRLFAAQGGRVVDSSPMYGSAESVIGDTSTELGINRQLFLATKVWTGGREAGMRQAQQSLSRMRREKLDLVQVHNLLDADTHLKWLKEWKQAGKIRYVGITHYEEGAFPALERYISSKQVDFVQMNYSITELDAERRLLPAALASGTAVIVNRPFAAASLFDRVKDRRLPEWAAEFGATSWAQFFLKYILGHPAVTCVIPATRNPKHLMDNMGAGIGKLPDVKMRWRMVDFLGSL